MILRGVYAITDEHLLPEARFFSALQQTVAAGVRLIQYRNKQGDPETRRQQASELLTLCQQHAIPLIINDDVDLCAAIGANGVHLGQGDCSLAVARERLGPQAIIGITCHQSLELANKAQSDGADYVAFGRFFPSTTKPGATPADPEILQAAKKTLDIPVVAIGGINAENGGKLIDSGADLLAVVGGIFGDGAIGANIQALNTLFSSQQEAL